YFHADWDIIPNGVDTHFFHPNGHRRPAADALTEGPRLLFLGRIEPRNGLGTLLDAMPRILARYPRALLTVAGDGPWRGYYARRARGLRARAGPEREGPRAAHQRSAVRPRAHEDVSDGLDQRLTDPRKQPTAHAREVVQQPGQRPTNAQLVEQGPERPLVASSDPLRVQA